MYHSVLQVEKLPTLSVPKVKLRTQVPLFLQGTLPIVPFECVPEKALKKPRSLYLVVWLVTDLGRV